MKTVEKLYRPSDLAEEFVKLAATTPKVEQMWMVGMKRTGKAEWAKMVKPIVPIGEKREADHVGIRTATFVKLIEELKAAGAEMIIVAHNHPKQEGLSFEDPTPSVDDVQTMKWESKIIKEHGMNLVEDFVVTLHAAVTIHDVAIGGRGADDPSVMLRRLLGSDV